MSKQFPATLIAKIAAIHPDLKEIFEEMIRLNLTPVGQNVLLNVCTLLGYAETCKQFKEEEGR
jgi:hypothetical protein